MKRISALLLSVTFDSGGRAVSKLAWRTNDGGDHQ